MAIEAVLDEVLKLSAEDRAELAERILDSLDEADVIEPGHHAAWTQEIERRLHEARTDRTKLTDMAEVMSRARATIGDRR